MRLTTSDMERKERNLILKITDYADGKRRFTLEKLYQDLHIEDSDKEFIESTLVARSSTTDNPNHLFAIVRSFTPIPNATTQVDAFRRGHEFALLPQAFYNYVDYIEIVEARNNAKEAKHFSIMALLIAVASLVIGTLVGLLGIIVQLLSNS
jgi:hypothetical protein